MSFFKWVPASLILVSGLAVSCGVIRTFEPEASAQSAATEILQPGEVRPLPGQLDTIPLFNSDSPEWIKHSSFYLSPHWQSNPCCPSQLSFQRPIQPLCPSLHRHA